LDPSVQCLEIGEGHVSKRAEQPPVVERVDTPRSLLRAGKR